MTKRRGSGEIGIENDGNDGGAYKSGVAWQRRKKNVVL